MTINSALTALCRTEFGWCRVTAGESVAVIAEPGSRDSYRAASIATAAAMGAKPIEIMLPAVARANDVPVVARGTGSSTILADHPQVVSLLGRTNFIVDVTLEGLVHSPETQTILGGGARMLWIREPEDALARLLPTEDRVRRIDRSVELLKSATEMTVTSKAGTRFKADLRGALITGSRR